MNDTLLELKVNLQNISNELGTAEAVAPHEGCVD